MRLLIGCLLSAFLACFFSLSHAQVAPSALAGKIMTENGSPADASTIVLLKSRDSSIVSTVVAGNNGAFHFSGLQPDSYLLLISKAGYQKMYAGPYFTKSGQTFTAPYIILKQLIQSLNEVSITSTRPDIEAQPGKLIINVQNNLLAQGNSAFDILRQSPGVRVDNSNNISIIGRQNALITIDGKPTNLSGEDLAGVLRSMQSNTIDRIELITSGTGKYDASSGGIINIVMKKGKNTGFNATITGTAGYGKYYKSNAGIVFNDRTEKVNIFGTYNFIDNKTFHDFTTDRKINFDDTLSDYHTEYNSIQRSQVHTFGIGTDFYLSSTQTIGFFVNGSISDDDITKDNDLTIYEQSLFDTTVTANSSLKRHVSRINYNLNYTGKLSDAGATLTADFDYTTYNRSSAEYITNRFYNESGTLEGDSLLQNLSPSAIHIWLSRVDFSGPLSKTSKLEAGIKFSDAISNNDLIFGPFVNGQYTSDRNFSDHFRYDENINAAYVNYVGKFGKWDLTTSLRAEQTIAKGTSDLEGRVVNDNYADLFPQALLSYKAGDKNEWSLSYNRGIKRPAYEDLNPFLYYVDLYDYRAGNPGLKPEYSNTIEFSYNYNKSLITTLYANTLNNAYEFPFYEQNDTTKINVTTQKNLGKIYTYGIRFNAPVVFTNWWNANFNIDASYQRYVAFPENGNLNKGTQDIIFNSAQYFNLGDNFLAEVSGRYETPSFYGINQFKAYYTMDAAVSKQLFEKRGNIKLGLTDIFNTLRDRGFTNYENLNITTIDKKETQIATLTFTYRFGKASIRAAHHTGNEEEQNRAAGGNQN
ncbi:MAG TPA: TonB-dependent receptor [Mucilaginibacter sp.]|jgi:outer membrane receptor protein involved in Fe transport|nr:TonB-dependent receptor [Mucilaginibacter sp.]